jgi:hypothetical protein
VFLAEEGEVFTEVETLAPSLAALSPPPDELYPLPRLEDFDVQSVRPYVTHCSHEANVASDLPAGSVRMRDPPDAFRYILIWKLRQCCPHTHIPIIRSQLYHHDDCTREHYLLLGSITSLSTAFGSIASPTDLVNHSLHLKAISVWGFPVLINRLLIYPVIMYSKRLWEMYSFIVAFCL